MKVYSLFDRKLMLFDQLFYARNDMAVMRGVSDGLKAQQGTVMANHPEDFDLYEVAEFDQVSGHLEGRAAPRLVQNLGDLVAEVAANPNAVRLRELG